MEAIDTIEKSQEYIQRAKAHSGYALNNYFYRSAVIYEQELKSIFLKSWIYACHISEIPNKGDFVTVEIGEDSIIVARDKQDQVSASANTCRHRGARVCTEKKGNTRAFVCPYHAWAYDLDGQLIGARSMGEDFNPLDFRLKKVNTHVYEGLVFINAATSPPDFSAATHQLDPFMKPYQLENAKVATSQTYTINANWKLCLENYLECYHCGPSHKEYGKSHSLKDEASKAAPLNEAMKLRAVNELGFDNDFISPVTGQYAKAPAFGCDISHMRYALYDKYQTGSLDGKPLAPLMGTFKGYDGGVGDFQFGPFTFMLNYPDHCVLYRFLPRGIRTTDIELVWYVNEDAQPGKDYDPERLTQLWNVTTEEDKFIIMQNSKGVNSQLYEPGPYSPVFEQLCINFVGWYLDTLDQSQ